MTANLGIVNIRAGSYSSIMSTVNKPTFKALVKEKKGGWVGENLLSL